MRKILIVLIASVMTKVSFAQTITPQQEREFFQKAYNLINIYSQSAKLSDDRDITQFKDLFEGGDIKICNDLMSLSYEPKLLLNDYIRLLHEADMVTVAVKNVQKVGPVREENGAWLMSVAFNKSISFVSKCNTLFDSSEFFGKDFRLMMTLVMEPNGEECRIRELNAAEELPEFPKNYRVLVKADKRDNNLDINGKYVKFTMDQKILRPEEKLSYRGAKVREKDMEGECDHKVFADYGDKLWRIRANGAFALSGFNKIGISGGGLNISKDKEISLGVDIGYVLPSTKHFRIGFFAGIGLSMNNLIMELMPTGDDLKYDAPPSADINEQGYIRNYEMLDNKGITQEMKATDIAIPIYVDMEYEFNSKLSIYADMGLKLQTSSGKMTTLIGKYKTSGDYGIGSLIDDPDTNDFGTHMDISVDNDGITKNMNINGLVALGLRFNINKSFAIDAGVQYQIGGKSWKANQGSIFSYTLEEGDKVNLLRKAGDISHNALKVAASLIYKF